MGTKKWMTYLSLVSNIIAKMSIIVSGLFIFALTIVLVIQVILRTFFSSGLSWSVEFSTFAIIWSVMLIANVLIKDNELINVDFLDHLFSDNFIKYRNIFYSVIFVVLLFIMTYYGWLQAINSINRTTATLGISWFYPYLSIPVGAAFMLYQYIYKIIDNIVNVKEV